MNESNRAHACCYVATLRGGRRDFEEVYVERDADRDADMVRGREKERKRERECQDSRNGTTSSEQLGSGKLERLSGEAQGDTEELLSRSFLKLVLKLLKFNKYQKKP